jgi:hypothetical protein
MGQNVKVSGPGLLWNIITSALENNESNNKPDTLFFSSNIDRNPNGISWFLGLPTVCGLGWLRTTFRNSLSVPSLNVNFNYSEGVGTRVT